MKAIGFYEKLPTQTVTTQTNHFFVSVDG